MSALSLAAAAALALQPAQADIETWNCDTEQSGSVWYRSEINYTASCRA